MDCFIARKICAARTTIQRWRSLTQHAELLQVLAQGEEVLWDEGVLSSRLQVQHAQLRHVLHGGDRGGAGLLEQDSVSQQT